MATYKLIYFDAMARAELTRLIFAASGTKYTDIRTDRTKWDADRERLNPPFGQLPILEYGDLRLSQSVTVARFAANQTGLSGKTTKDRAMADMIVDCITDIFDEALQYAFESDASKKQEKEKKFKGETGPKKCVYLEKMFDQSPGNWFVGSDLTWADLALMNLCFWIETVGLQVPTSAPKLTALRLRVASVPAVAKWIAARPKTPF